MLILIDAQKNVSSSPFRQALGLPSLVPCDGINREPHVSAIRCSRAAEAYG